MPKKLPAGGWIYAMACLIAAVANSAFGIVTSQANLARSTQMALRLVW